MSVRVYVCMQVIVRRVEAPKWLLARAAKLIFCTHIEAGCTLTSCDSGDGRNWGWRVARANVDVIKSKYGPTPRRYRTVCATTKCRREKRITLGDGELIDLAYRMSFMEMRGEAFWSKLCVIINIYRFLILSILYTTITPQSNATIAVDFTQPESPVHSDQYPPKIVW